MPGECAEVLPACSSNPICSFSLILICAISLAPCVGIRSLTIHQETGEHIQAKQQRHGQRQHPREDLARRAHQGDRPGQPGPETFKRSCS